MSAETAPAAGPETASEAVPDAHAQALARGREFLRRARDAGGAWPYRPGGAPRPEPTVLAAAAAPDAEQVAVDWLSAQDLGWAGFLLPAVAWDRAPELCRAELDRLQAFQSTPVEGVDGFDATIPGWSWVAGTAAWVEPTAFALLSLRRAGVQGPRVDQGQALLVDRQCSDGGWNYGNPEVYGARLDGHLDATGWAVLALQPGEAAQRGLVYLQGALRTPSTMALSLAALAAAAHQVDPRPWLDLLAPRVGAEGARGRVDLTALACAALALSVEGRHAFR